MPADGGVDGVEVEYKAVAGTGNKKKRKADAIDDDEEVAVKPKRGRPPKKEAAKASGGTGDGKEGALEEEKAVKVELEDEEGGADAHKEVQSGAVIFGGEVDENGDVYA